MEYIELGTYLGNDSQLTIDDFRYDVEEYVSFGTTDETKQWINILGDGELVIKDADAQVDWDQYAALIDGGQIKTTEAGPMRVVWDHDLTHGGKLTIYVTLPGDFNADGKVNFADIAMLTFPGNLGATTPPTDPEPWDGYWDGVVNYTEIADLQTNIGYGTSAAAAAVPEPSTFILLTIGAVGPCRLCRSASSLKSDNTARSGGRLPTTSGPGNTDLRSADPVSWAGRPFSLR